MKLVAGGVEHIDFDNIIDHELVEQHVLVYGQCDSVGLKGVCSGVSRCDAKHVVYFDYSDVAQFLCQDEA